jgi:hypothetical protein
MSYSLKVASSFNFGEGLFDPSPDFGEGLFDRYHFPFSLLLQQGNFLYGVETFCMLWSSVKHRLFRFTVNFPGQVSENLEK